jgi:hypothetical protein
MKLSFFSMSIIIDTSLETAVREKIADDIEAS